jgi:hypothetical protein
MECETAQSHCTQSAGVVSRVRSPGGEIQTVGCEARYARGRPERAQQSSVRVRNDDDAFYCSYRNKTWPTAVYPSYEYSP